MQPVEEEPYEVTYHEAHRRANQHLADLNETLKTSLENLEKEKGEFKEHIQALDPEPQLVAEEAYKELVSEQQAFLDTEPGMPDIQDVYIATPEGTHYFPYESSSDSSPEFPFYAESQEPLAVESQQSIAKLKNAFHQARIHKTQRDIFQQVLGGAEESYRAAIASTMIGEQNSATSEQRETAAEAYKTRTQSSWQL